MTGNDHQQYGGNKQNLENDALDRELDKLLVRFAVVEPRAGLEQRILANLRAQEHSLARPLWYWPTLGVAAAVVIVAVVSMLWRSGKPTLAITSHQPTTVQANRQTGTDAANNNLDSPVRPVPITTNRLASQGVRRSRYIVPSAPKLDQFPSPQPLSAQEQILASYVSKFQEDATLVARARMESLQKDVLEEAENASPDRETGMN
jgi:hypothetical protein